LPSQTSKFIIHEILDDKQQEHDPVSSAINLFEHCWGDPNTIETSSQMGGFHPLMEKMNHAGRE